MALRMSDERSEQSHWFIADKGLAPGELLANPRYQPLLTIAKHGDTVTVGDGMRYKVCHQPDGTISLLYML